mmetsp:Transcript_13451/g.21319  ORF Transcript_13451/g.21319 Transcript_13451/m.21319 type:complete len:140 (-) Transcript_13451:1321-1740(-)
MCCNTLQRTADFHPISCICDASNVRHCVPSLRAHCNTLHLSGIHPMSMCCNTLQHAADFIQYSAYKIHPMSDIVCRRCVRTGNGSGEGACANVGSDVESDNVRYGAPSLEDVALETRILALRDHGPSTSPSSGPTVESE